MNFSISAAAVAWVYTCPRASTPRIMPSFRNHLSRVLPISSLSVDAEKYARLQAAGFGIGMLRSASLLMKLTMRPKRSSVTVSNLLVV